MDSESPLRISGFPKGFLMFLNRFRGSPMDFGVPLVVLSSPVDFGVPQWISGIPKGFRVSPMNFGVPLVILMFPKGF